jgi:hypothetical protein
MLKESKTMAKDDIECRISKPQMQFKAIGAYDSINHLSRSLLQKESKAYSFTPW